MMDGDLSMLLLMLGMGLMGSLHCIGMCGGLVAAVSMGVKEKRWQGLLVYQLGRITTYAWMGALVGGLGVGLHDLGGSMLQQGLALLAGFLMVIFGLNLAGWLPDPLHRLSRFVSARIGLIQLGRSLAAHARMRGWFALGLANGFLPCGLVYAALAMALASGQVVHASLMMLAFGMGTIPAMMLLPSLLQRLSPELRLNSMRLAGVLMLALGVMMVWRSMMPMGMHTMM